MRVITKKRWLTEDSYVEVRYRPRWFSANEGRLDVYYFVRDPRKSQYHKPKYWSKGSTHMPVCSSFNISGNCLFGGNGYYRKAIVAAREIFKELRLTSSDSRAAA